MEGASFWFLPPMIPVMKISMPIPIRITPLRMDALPARRVWSPNTGNRVGGADIKAAPTSHTTVRTVRYTAVSKFTP